MKRDMDFVRELLLQIESADEPNLADLLPENANDSDRKKYQNHLEMLIEQAGLVTGIDASSMSGPNWLDLKLTWNGHEFLDAVRDPEIWRKAKDGASAVGTETIDFLWQIAKAYAKHIAKEKLGLALE